jgi:hypothetical protein
MVAVSTIQRSCALFPFSIGTTSLPRRARTTNSAGTRRPHRCLKRSGTVVTSKRAWLLYATAPTAYRKLV